MRRKLPQINQNFKGSTFKDGDQTNRNGTNRDPKRHQMNNTNTDTSMGSTSFLDSSCTLPVSKILVQKSRYILIEDFTR